MTTPTELDPERTVTAVRNMERAYNSPSAAILGETHFGDLRAMRDEVRELASQGRLEDAKRVLHVALSLVGCGPQRAD